MNFEQALCQMPHSGPMRLIRRIVSADQTSIHCVAVDHNYAGFPLQLDGVLHTVTLVELGAQAAAAHASLFETRGNHTGLLVALQNIELAQQKFECIPDPLLIFATQLHFDTNGSIYRFRICSREVDLLTGQATLKMKGKQE